MSDLDTPDLRRVGLAIECSDRVSLLLLTDYGVRTEFREAYHVTEPDGSEVIYQPGTSEYFDHVLLTLSRGFLVSHVGTLQKLNSLAVQQLFHDEVIAKQPRPRPSEYVLEQVALVRPTPRVVTPNTNGENGHGATRRPGPIRTAA